MTVQTQKSTHLFLASIGKTMLRPGGREATEKIIADCNITKDTKILEVAPNMGTTAVQLAKTYGCQIIGVDIHAQLVEKAQQNIRDNQLEHWIQIQKGDAMHLPFIDHTFDVVLNEAMLTMLSDEQKKKALSEYYRVLKPGGKLATHDMLLKQKPDHLEIQSRMQKWREFLQVNARPCTKEGWIGLIEVQGFQDLSVHIGKMRLLSFRGLVYDEGWDGLMKMIDAARKTPETEARFFELISRFDENEDLYGYIALTAAKPEE